MFFIHSILNLLAVISNSLMYVLSYFCLQLSNYQICIFKLPIMNMFSHYFFRYFILYIQLLYYQITYVYYFCIFFASCLLLLLYILSLFILLSSLDFISSQSDFRIASTFSPSSLPSSSPPSSSMCTRQFIVYPVAFEIF